MRRLTLILILLAIVPLVSATEVASEEVKIELGEPDKVSVERHYDSITTERISYLVMGRYNPQNLTAMDDQGELDCEVESLAIGSELLCNPRHESNYTVEISYIADFSEKNGEERSLSFLNRVFAPTDEVAVRVVLPEGYGVVEGEGSYSPTNASVGSSGRKIFLQWRNRNVSIGDTLRYNVNYESLSVFESLALRQLTFILAISLIAMGFLVVYLRRKYGGEKTIASVFPVLKEDEKDVLRYIIENEGEAEQRAIVDNLDYSKAKISRLISDLEDRKLVIKEKRGRVNVVELARDVGDIEG
ncbi:MAG: hypothetical protein MUP63_00240 [Candidatus Nanohaloarchaeota archaeon QJJ-7]|nr:hypothetical protein [Candidatus Nanohaloarchaeota archaeon QJJ-7]